jgi:hypothetical protein
LYNAFDSPEAGRMRTGMAADWYFDVHVNGRKVYDAMTGNRSALLQPEDHVFDFPVKKGPNIMTVRVLAGSRGWKFICGTVDADAGRLVKITESKKYRPLDMGRLLVKSGTALDFSALNGPRQKAGALGRVIANTDGKLAFEKAPGTPVRFFSFVYIMANSWRLKNHLWTKQDTEHFADAIANQGYNMVRLHTLDRYLLGYKVNDPQYPDMTVAAAGIPQTAKEIPIDEGNLDRFFYLVHCLKERGIYLNMDLMTTWSGYTMAGYRARKSGEQFREHMFFDEKYRQHWKAASGFLLTTTNPYTGLALKDDPALACIDFLNEQDLRMGDPATMAVFTKPFRGWLKTKYQTGAALSKAWGKPLALDNTPAIDETLLRAGDTAASDAATFLTETMLEMTDWYVKIVRDEIGYKGLYNQWDMIMRTLELPVRARLPAIAQHTYFAHPHFIPTSGKAPKTDSSRYLGGVENDMVVDQTSSLGSTYFRAAAMARFLDRPYMITEYSHSAPNRFRHERGLYFGSCAALQGWDVLTTFTDTVRLTLDDAFGGFDNAIDPVSRASEIVTALAWLRGDVRESPHSVAYVPEPEKLFPGNYLAAMSDDYAKTAFLTKVGIVWPSASGEKPSFPVNKTRPSLTIVPEKFSRLNVDQWYVTADNRDGGEFPELVRQFREARLLPESNKTQADRAFYQSDTGELSLDEKAEEMTVVSPRLEGVILKKNHPVDLGNLRVVSCSEPAAIVAASLDKNANLGDASRVLLVIATNAFNTDMVFENKSYHTCLDAGRPPVLIQSVAVSLELTTRHEKTPEIYALNMDGTRMAKLGSRLENGRLKLSIDTSGLEHGTPCFEIVFPE